jgi:hypothetical protein
MGIRDSTSIEEIIESRCEECEILLNQDNMAYCPLHDKELCENCEKVNHLRKN